MPKCVCKVKRGLLCFVRVLMYNRSMKAFAGTLIGALGTVSLIYFTTPVAGFSLLGTSSETVSIRVSSSSDDAEEELESGTVDLSSSDLELGREDDDDDDHDDDEEEEGQLVAMRFRSVVVPQGAHIANAYIEFEVDEREDEAARFIISGEASNNAVSFVRTRGSLTARTKTQASVAWENVDTWKVTSEKKQTPDVSAIVQEIVGREGWRSGNAVAFFVSGTGKRVAESYNGKRQSAPLLVISYTTSDNHEPSPTVVPSVTSQPQSSPTTTPTPTLSPAPTRGRIPGDADNNGVVNILDFQILSFTFGSTTDLRADFDDTKIVNILDYQILAYHF